MIGLVFFPRSPRFLQLPDAAHIASVIPSSVLRVGLFVDPTDDELDKTRKAVALDMIQLHGAESPARVAEIRSRYKLPVMKALPVGSAADLDAASAYEASCDWLLFDARPPAKAVLPGGNGVSFDWHLLAGRSWNRPWMLSGGLNPANVAEAIRISGAEAVDVSSGVETSPGAKNAGLVREFIDATLAP
jgi:phosphoribosylanthranilate isomerase